MTDIEQQENDVLAALEAGARSFVDHIEAVVRASLENGIELLTCEDRKALEYSIARLLPSFDALTKQFIDAAKETSASRLSGIYKVGFGYEKLWELMAASFYAGQAGTVTETAKAYFTPEVIDTFKKDHAARMRAKRAGAASERALLAAIKRFHGAERPSKPNKIAAAILPQVNAELELNEFPSVKIDVVRRRLEKLPRS